MTWYILVDKKTGEAVSSGSVIAPGARDDFEVLEYAEKPEEGNKYWDKDLKQFVDNPLRIDLAQFVVNDATLNLTQEQKDLISKKLKELFP